MIVEEIFGDMLRTDCQTITVPINKVGAMGKGLALYFAKNYPHIVPTYKEHCRIKTFNTKLVTIPINNDKLVLLLPTKNHWKENSNEWLIEHSLSILVKDYEELGIKSLAMPKIGCGCGNLDFDNVKEIIYKYLNPISIPVKLYI